MTIVLTSSIATHLVLRTGGGIGTDSVTYNFGTPARITEDLSAGTYTIEATTFEQETTGSFELTVSLLGAIASDGGRLGVATTVPQVTYNGNVLNNRIGIIDLYSGGLQQGHQIDIELSVRDHECEDGDIVAVFVTGLSDWREVFYGEIFNRSQTRTFRATVGYNYTVAAIAINGTGFKGNCSHRDVNTGEMTVRYGGVQERAIWNAPGGSGSAGVINVRP